MWLIAGTEADGDLRGATEIADHQLQEFRQLLDIETVVLQQVGPLGLGGRSEQLKVTTAAQLAHDRIQPRGDLSMGVHVRGLDSSQPGVVDPPIAFLAGVAIALLGAA